MDYFCSKSLDSSISLIQSNQPFQGYGFIAFLGLIQRLKIDVLPIAWQTQRGRVGIGGQAGISQALVNAETNFAFKRFKIWEGDWYQPIIQELVALGQPFIQKHPHIASLEGICFECEIDDSVRPVLVFEMAPMGDLDRFMRTENGQALSIDQRLKLCADIGRAIGDVHAQSKSEVDSFVLEAKANACAYIIHGDLNPGNVLVFKEDEEYVAKIADFGYSTLFQDETACISIPYKEGWNAPEHIDSEHRDGYRSRNYEPLAAKRIDIYSYGLLCLWLCAKSCEDLPKPKDHHRNRDQYLSFIGKIEDLNNRKQEDLMELIHLTLAYEPERRCLDFRRLLSHISPLRANDAQQNKPVIESVLLPAAENFQIARSSPELYIADFRVRPYIVGELQNILSQPEGTVYQHITRENAVSQLAWCYRLGFGLPADRDRATQLMKEIPLGKRDSVDQPGWLRGKHYDISIGDTLFKKLIGRGHIWPLHLPTKYRQDGVRVSDRALETLRREVDDMKTELGPEHRLVILSISNLASVLSERGQHLESVEILTTMLKLQEKTLSADDLSTWDTRAHLAKAHRELGQLEEAIRLGRICVKKREIDNPLSIKACDAHDDLAATLRSVDRYKEAEELERAALQKKQDLSPFHVQTLRGKNNLALTLQKQGRYAESQTLYEETVRLMRATLGEESANTLACTENLASVYSDQSINLRRAAEMLEAVINTRRKFYPEAYFQQLTTMGNLAEIYRRLGDYQEALKKTKRALTLSQEHLGNQNPRTLALMNNLASIYQNQGEWAQASEMQKEWIELEPSISPKQTLHNINNIALTWIHNGARSKAEEKLKTALAAADGLNNDDPLILAARNTLAFAHQQQGRWQEAQNMHGDIVSLAHRKLGPTHQDTLIYQQNLALDNKNLGSLDEAISLLEATYIAQRDTPDIGPNHEDTKASEGTLAAWRALRREANQHV